MSEFKLYPVPESKRHIALPLAQMHMSEINRPKIFSMDCVRQLLEDAYANRSGGVYVDDLENPKHLLGMVAYKPLISNQILAEIVTVYSPPEQRGDSNIMKVMIQTAENFAKMHGAVAVLGASWKYEGSRGIDAIWKRLGYTETQTTYIKELWQEQSAE